MVITVMTSERWELKGQELICLHWRVVLVDIIIMHITRQNMTQQTIAYSYIQKDSF